MGSIGRLLALVPLEVEQHAEDEGPRGQDEPHVAHRLDEAAARDLGDLLAALAAVAVKVLRPPRPASRISASGRGEHGGEPRLLRVGVEHGPDDGGVVAGPKVDLELVLEWNEQQGL